MGGMRVTGENSTEHWWNDFYSEELLAENLSQYHFAHQKSHMD